MGPVGTTRRSRRRRQVAVLATAVTATVLSSAGWAGAASSPGAGPRGLTAHRSVTSPTLTAADEGGGETQELIDRTEQYAQVRTAPAATVSSKAFEAAAAQAAALPAAGGTWREMTDRPYDSDAPYYRDPTWSNSSGGAGFVTGRISAVVADGGTLYVGAAAGGVWRSTDGGAHWTPTFDTQTNLSVGALAVDPADHSLWVGTGEANGAVDNFQGDGIYRSADRGASWQLVGNRPANSLVSRLTFDGQGHVYAATSQGLLRRSTIDLTAPWTTVLKPDPNPDASPYRGSWTSDVQVRPGTHGTQVVAVVGAPRWALPSDLTYNGFYASTDGGATFTKVTPEGIDGQTARTSLDYGRDGSLYAVVEDTDFGLKGVYRSATGAAQGPWTVFASEAQLNGAPGNASGDAGVQAWYDQYVRTDPRDPAHVYVGLTEVYETSDSGASWTTIGPYWNFGKSCWSSDPAKDTCPDTVHADQHAAWVTDDGTAVFGNDGGVYSRPANLRKVVKWHDLNVGLDTLQYYSAGVGALLSGGDAVYGGLQDNGYSLLRPDKDKMVSPFGGDGTNLIVDPNNANKSVESYVYLTMARTETGGVSYGGSKPAYTTITPTCRSFIDVSQGDIQPCDPNPRFVAPFEADQTNVQHWVAGGQMVWDNQGKGWSTTCTPSACDWKMVHDLGSGAQSTALGVSGATTYAGWCGNGCNPAGSLPFTSGIDTNYGGTWHRVSSSVLPQRIPTSFAVDPADAAHVVVTYGAFSRRWIANGGVGHVFESRDGGTTWTDVSGNLPDAPTSDVLLTGNRLVVATDVGVFTGTLTGSAAGSWSRWGTSLPAAPVLDLAPSPRGDYVVAATHGRGLWKLDLG